MIYQSGLACSSWTSYSSGLLLDRIDIHIEVPRVEYEKLSDNRLGELSSIIQERVERALEIQRHRFAARDHPHPEKARPEHGLASPPPIICNADMRPAEALKYRPKSITIVLNSWRNEIHST